MAKIIEKIVVDDSQHSEKLKKAKSELRSYAASQQSTGSIIKGVTAVVGKFAVGLGVATTATAALSKILGSTQTTGDNMRNAMAAASSTVETFANAIATCDMSAFSNGLSGVISRAIEANKALDQLGNTLISFNYFKAGVSADLAEQMTILRDKGATQEQKEQAKQEAQQLIEKQREMVTNMNTQIMNAVRTAIARDGKGVLNAGQIGRSDIDKIFAVDVFGNPSINRRQLADRYKEYQMKETQRRSQGNTRNGTRQELIAEYKDAILFNMMLENMSDEQLQDIANKIQQAENERRALASEMKALNRAMSGVDTPTVKTPTVKTPKVTVPEQEPLVEGSLAWYQDRLSKANKELQNAATDEARYAASKVVEELQLQITRMKQSITAQGLDLSTPKTDFKQDVSLLPKISPESSKELADYMENQKKLQEQLEETREKFYGTADAIGDMGHAFSSMGRNLNMPALDVMGTIAQAVASMMLGYAQATTQAAKLGPIAWAAFAASGLAQVIGIVSQIKSVGKFANGAIAYGPTLGLFGEYSGAANNPEVVAPLDRLRSLIGEPAGMGGQVEFHIQGKELYGILNKQNRTNSRNA